MKIIQLQFENINNLKGKHSIYFDQIPLSTAGIFAIVGPTGSGKSTILDVITLALYNKIPRFKNAITKNNIFKEGSVVTHHTKKAFAAIEYEVKGQKYKSLWSVESNRNGELKDYEMTFYNPDGSVVDLKKSEVPAHNSTIIGLKYDQFLKSILLSQGEFSKFLKSDKNEQGALLENLTGTSIYRKIGQKTFEKHQNIKKRLEEEEKLIQFIQVLDKKERDQLEVELKDSQREKVSLDNDINTSNQLLQLKKSVKNIQSSLKEKHEAFKEINKKTEAFTTDLKRINTHQKLSHLQGDSANYFNAIERSKQSKISLEEYETNLKKAKDKHQSSINEMSKLTKKDVDEDCFKSVMIQFETEINKADNDLKNLNTNGKEARKTVNKIKENYPISLDDKINPKKAVLVLNERAKTLEEITNHSKIDKTQSFELLKKSLQKDKDLLYRLGNIKAYFQDIEEYKKELELKQKELDQYSTTIESKIPLAEKCEKLLQSTNDKIDLLNKQKEDALKIAKLEELRFGLVSGESCPLCGSLEHPFTENHPDHKHDTIDTEIISAKSTLRENEKELKNLNKEITTSKTALHLTSERINQVSVKSTKINTELKIEMDAFSSDSKPNADNIIEIIESKTIEIKNTEEAINAISEIKQNKILIGQYEQLQNYYDDYKTLKEQRDEKFDGEEINAITNKLQDAFEASKSTINSLKSNIDKESKTLDEALKLVSSIKNELEPKIKEFGFKDISEIKKHILDELTLNKLIQTKNRLSETKTQINTQINTLNDDLLKNEALDTNQELSVEVLEIEIKNKQKSRDQHQTILISNRGKLERDDEDLRKVKDKEKSISKLKVKVKKWSLLNKMIGDSKGNKFANFAQGLTLQNLLVYANRRLSSLSDRYLLNKQVDEGSLIIIDKYQGNISRSVKTLSGGESFLISLAMALSLSDMASKNIAIDCLFIDEGFGTLDAETLELAMTTLEKIQSENQKTVGIISHVEAIKERIDVQIQLNKNTQGYSQIELKD